MCIKQFVYQLADPVQAELAGQQRVYLRSLVQKVAAPGQNALDGQQLDVDSHPVQGGTGLRQETDSPRDDRPSSHRARDLNAAVLGQVLYEMALVGHVAHERERDI